MDDTGSDDIDSLLVEVRASTRGFDQDISQMRATVDGTLADGFARAGTVLERGLLGAIRRGSLGFGDLRRIALNTINEIATQSVQNLFSGSVGNRGGASGLLNLGSSLVGSILGLPGRATGGPVAPGAAYIVGERGPELFVPTASGRVEPGVTSPAPASVQAGAAAPGPAPAQTVTTSRIERVREYVSERQLPPEPRPYHPAPAPMREPREVRVAINVVSPQGASVPQSLRRSSRQVASAVRRAIAFN